MPVDEPQFPVNLNLRGRKCLVVGGGQIAARKIEGLLAAEAIVHVIAPSICENVKALPVTFEARLYQDGDVAGYRLVTTATDDPAVNRAVFEDGERHGIWVNAADDPDSCSFTLPAIIRRGALTVAISTAGYSPALATWIKNRAASDVGPEFETLLSLLAELRTEIKESGRTTEHLPWQEAIPGALTHIRNGEDDQAAAHLRSVVLS